MQWLPHAFPVRRLAGAVRSFFGSSLPEPEVQSLPEHVVPAKPAPDRLCSHGPTAFPRYLPSYPRSIVHRRNSFPSVGTYTKVESNDMQALRITFLLAPDEATAVERLWKLKVAGLEPKPTLPEFCRAVVLSAAGVTATAAAAGVDAAELRAAREQRGLTQRQVGALFRRPQSAVAAWEAGTRPVPRRLVPAVRQWIASEKLPGRGETKPVPGRTRRTAWERLLEDDLVGGDD